MCGNTAALLEEGAEESGRFGLQDPGRTGVSVVQARVRGEIVEGTGGAGFGVGRGVDKAAYSGSVESAGAHRARFKGGVEGTAGETPAPELTSGAAEGE